MMHRHLLLIALFVLFVPFARAQEPQEKPDYDAPDFYMRAVTPEGKKSPRSLETAVVRFIGEKGAKNEGLRVDLIGAIHVGDRAYYEALNKRFTAYEVVLYELVAPEGTTVEKYDKQDIADSKRENPLALLQFGMADMLKLTHQLEHIDYKAKNFVHADLDPEEFFRRFGERGDLIQMLLRSVLLGLKKAEDKEGMNRELRSQGRLLGAMLARDPALPLKRTAAGLMIESMKDGAWVLGGEGSAIITDRNAACLKKLRAQIAAGKKHIAIFYGGAHLPEFAKSLEKDFRLRYDGRDWIVAWDLK